jgi:hypothetical protein
LLHYSIVTTTLKVFIDFGGGHHLHTIIPSDPRMYDKLGLLGAAFGLAVTTGNTCFVAWQILQSKSIFNMGQFSVCLMALSANLAVLTSPNPEARNLMTAYWLLQGLGACIYISLALYRFKVFSQFMAIPPGLLLAVNIINWTLGITNAILLVRESIHRIKSFMIRYVCMTTTSCSS